MDKNFSRNMFTVPVLSSPIVSAPAFPETSSKRVSERIKSLQKRIYDESIEKSIADVNAIKGIEQGPQQKVSRLKKTDMDHGTAFNGSKSAERVTQANNWVKSEIDKLLEIIIENAEAQDPVTGYMNISFGKLFNLYQDISNTLVGILMRARKRKLIAYEGEMLYQGADDDVIISVCGNVDTI